MGGETLKCWPNQVWLHRLQDAGYRYRNVTLMISKFASSCYKYHGRLHKYNAVIIKRDTSIYHVHMDTNNQISLCFMLTPYPEYDQNQHKPHNRNTHVHVNTLRNNKFDHIYFTDIDYNFCLYAYTFTTSPHSLFIHFTLIVHLSATVF